MPHNYDGYGGGLSEKEKSIEFRVAREHCVALKNPPELPKVWKQLNRPPEFGMGSGRVFDGDEKKAKRLRELGFPNADNLRKGDLFVIYCRGDYFLSLSVVLHEVGHLLQEKFNTRLSHVDTFDPDSTSDAKTYKLSELDASTRGWKLFAKYCPEILGKIESDFKRFKRQGKLPEFGSFEEMFEFGFVGDQMRNMLNAINATRDWTTAEKEKHQDKKWLELMRADHVDDGFARLNKMRTGENIDEELVRDIFEDIGNGILEELKQK